MERRGHFRMSVITALFVFQKEEKIMFMCALISGINERIYELNKAEIQIQLIRSIMSESEALRQHEEGANRIHPDEIVH